MYTGNDGKVVFNNHCAPYYQDTGVCFEGFGSENVTTEDCCSYEDLLTHSYGAGKDEPVMVTFTDYCGPHVQETLRSVQSIDKEFESDIPHKWKFCKPADTANVITTPSAGEVCFPFVPHTANADFTGDGLDDVLVFRYEKKDSATGDDPNDYELVVEVIAETHKTSIAVELVTFGEEEPLTLAGAVISVELYMYVRCPIVAIGTTKALYLLQFYGYYRNLITLSTLRPTEDMGMAMDLIEHTTRQTVTDIVLRLDFSVDGSTSETFVSVFWADYFGHAVRHMYIDLHKGPDGQEMAPPSLRFTSEDQAIVDLTQEDVGFVTHLLYVHPSTSIFGLGQYLRTAPQMQTRP